MVSQKAFIAANRFGMGSGPSEQSIIETAPTEWLRKQVQPVDGRALGFHTRPHSSAWFSALAEARRSGKDAVKSLRRSVARPQFMDETVFRIETAVQNPSPFQERLRLFWANHFTVSATRAMVGPAVGGFEREAISPHLFGYFENMLIAAVQHPAMLIYLDNAVSVGPQSRAGKRRSRGLNENLAREILELHTLGVEGGYQQQDIIEFAKILTGWTVDSLHKRLPNKGNFYFLENFHEPGSKTFLGQTWSEKGVEEGVSALRLLARHPATAKHIATKLARHFVSDTPSAASIDRLSKVYLQTRGDLRAMSLALIDLPEIWETPGQKIKNHFEYVISILRITGPENIPMKLVQRGLKEMGYTVFGAPSPEGWPDTAREWLMPQSLMRRIEFARVVAERSRGRKDVNDLIDRTIDPMLSDMSRDHILGAASQAEAVALVFSSPEFQRR
ncbi:DUF1800 domain-containing protein [Sneathiella aquimaris]|uniref:DUF1800 domain-containing protein n=1 Tax=Sneathiella aquimaris TaxID=2599305 RepID=UPI00146B9F87|nr:DUF1800 domain-containing protein [Sneathiella aquimaris]